MEVENPKKNRLTLDINKSINELVKRGKQQTIVTNVDIKLPNRIISRFTSSTKESDTPAVNGTIKQPTRESEV